MSRARKHVCKYISIYVYMKPQTWTKLNCPSSFVMQMRLVLFVVQDDLRFHRDADWTKAFNFLYV